MKDSGLTEILAQIITDNREKKLNKILTISNNIKIMKDSGLTEIVAQIISDNREKKLNKILNNI
jgi:ribosomal protein L18